MTAITAQELTDMRVVSDDFLPDTCTIQTKTETVDAQGGVSLSWANTYTSVACRLDPAAAGGSEVVTNLALEARSLWTLNIPYNQAIGVENRVVHGGVTYEVKGVIDTNSYVTIRRATLVRVN
jgi:hypothetical protein